MASTANTFAIPAPASANKPAPSSQRVSMPSILAAAIGLTSLGAPTSPSKSSPSPSESCKEGVTKKASIETNKAIQASQNPYMSNRSAQNPYISKPPDLMDNREIIKPAVNEPIVNMTTMPLPKPKRAIMRAPFSSAQPPVAHYLRNMPPYPATAAAHPSALKTPMPWSSSIRPSLAGFATLQVPLKPHYANPFYDADMAMDRFSMAGRVAAMDRAAVAAAAASAPDHPSFPYYAYHQYNTASLPPLPTPHQTSPVPSTKNFPETLFDIISSEEHLNIISWLPHGNGFIIVDKQHFANMILPRYFDGAKFTSFTRRLKRWSFVRVPRGPELGAYYNENFSRDQPELVQKMRYRMDGQFEEGKKKSEDKNEEKEKLEEQTEKEVERKSQKSLLKRAHTQVNDELPKLTSQDDYKKQIQQQQNHVLAAKIPSPKIKTTYLTNLQESPMLPLPSTLPKRPKLAASHKKMNPTAVSGVPVEPLRNDPAHTTANAESSLLPRGYPTLVSPNDPNERRFMEAQRELLLARSMMSHEVVGSVARSVPASTAGLRSNMAGSSISSHPCYTTAYTAALRMRDLERAEHIAKAERALGLTCLSADHHRSSYKNPNRELMASKILPSSKTHEEIMDAAARSLQPRLLPPSIQLSERHPRGRSNIRESNEEGNSTNLQREHWNMTLSMSCNSLAKVPQGELNAKDLWEARRTPGELHSGHGIGDGRPVMMSREEEEEFAEYLFMKRGHNVRRAQAPVAWK